MAPVVLFSHTKTLGQKRRPSNQEPTVESSETESNDAKRQAKGRRYDKLKSGPIVELASDVEELPLNSHWWKGIPALPIAESDAIVVGEVLNGKAHLSNNRSIVYSEFPTRVDQILKNSGPTILTIGETIVGERLGGGVRFPSGKVQHYRVSKQGLPQTNEKYVLFLKCNGEDYDIITGYSINKGRVSPLDGGGDLQFGKYEGKPVDSFLSELLEAKTLPCGKRLKRNEKPPPPFPRVINFVLLTSRN